VAISEDTGNQPVAVHSAVKTATTAAFVPASSTLLVALVAVDGAANLATTVALSDSAGGSWSLLKRQNSIAASTLGGSSEVWCRWCATSPGSITVTASWSTNGQPGGNLVVRSLLGADSTQTGATGGTGGGSVSPAASLTPTALGSWVYGAALDYSTNATLAANANSTSIDQFLDASNGDTWATFKGKVATASLVSTSYGFTNGAAAYNLAAAEILPAAAAATATTPVPLVVTTPVRAWVAAPWLGRSTLQDDLVLTTPGPLVVTSQPRLALPAQALLRRSSTADASTSRPLVISRPAPQVLPAQPTILRSSLADLVVPTAGVPAPIVVTAVTRVTPPAPAQLLRSTLADPPVLTTPAPMVVSQPARPALPSQAQVWRSSLADAAAPPASSTPQPLVVSTAVRPALPAAPTLSRSSLLDTVVVSTSTPAPLVVSAQACAAVPHQAILARSALVDVATATPGPLVPALQLRVTIPAPALLRRGSLADPVIPPAATTRAPLIPRWPASPVRTYQPQILRGVGVLPTPPITAPDITAGPVETAWRTGPPGTAWAPGPAELAWSSGRPETEI
jgi:hypothetical protein